MEIIRLNEVTRRAPTQKLVAVSNHDLLNVCAFGSGDISDWTCGVVSSDT